MKGIAEITKDCLELSSAQRLKLARILLDLSETEGDYSPEVAAAWDEEIGARLAAVKAGTARSLPLDSVLADLDRQFPS